MAPRTTTRTAELSPPGAFACPAPPSQFPGSAPGDDRKAETPGFGRGRRHAAAANPPSRGRRARGRRPPSAQAEGLELPRPSIGPHEIRGGPLSRLVLFSGLVDRGRPCVSQEWARAERARSAEMALGGSDVPRPQPSLFSSLIHIVGRGPEVTASGRGNVGFPVVIDLSKWRVDRAMVETAEERWGGLGRPGRPWRSRSATATAAQPAQHGPGADAGGLRERRSAVEGWLLGSSSEGRTWPGAGGRWFHGERLRRLPRLRRPPGRGRLSGSDGSCRVVIRSVRPPVAFGGPAIRGPGRGVVLTGVEFRLAMVVPAAGDDRPWHRGSSPSGLAWPDAVPDAVPGRLARAPTAMVPGTARPTSAVGPGDRAGPASAGWTICSSRSSSAFA